MTFRKYLYGILVVVIVVPLIALGIQQYFHAKDSLENKELIGKLTAELVGREIQARLEITKTVVESAANRLGSEQSRDPESLNQYLKDLMIHAPYILNIHYDNKQAKSIAFYPKENEQGQSNIGVDHSSRHHWKKIEESSVPVISDVVQAVGAANVPIVNIIVPARDRKNRLVGYAVCALNLNKLVENVTSRIAPGEFNIWVFDRKGVPVFSNTLSKDLVPYLSSDEIKNVMKNGGAWVTLKRGGMLDLSGFLQPLPQQDWTVGIFRKISDKETETGVLIWSSLLFFLVVLLITVLAASAVTQPLINKLKLLMFYAFDYKGNYKNVDSITTPEEFGKLQKLIGRLNNQKKIETNNISDINLAIEREFHRRISGYTEEDSFVNEAFCDVELGIIFVDKQDNILYMNKFAKDLLAYKSGSTPISEVIEESFYEDDAKIEHRNLSSQEVVLTSKANGQRYIIRRYKISGDGPVVAEYLISSFTR